MRYVSTIIAFNDEGKCLFGRRRDNGKWTNIGGHVDEGENPHDAALRELKEEAGLQPAGGNLEYVGEDYFKDKDRTIVVFKCPVSGIPSNASDPDQEMSEFAFFGPEEIPQDSELHVPLAHNVLLGYFMPENQEAPKARLWKAKDGITIPESGSKDRQMYNKSHAELIAKHFAGGDQSKIKRISILTEFPQGFNGSVNKARESLYTRMAQAKEPLPLVVVKRSGSGYSLLDGNHRQVAAQKAGLARLQAFEIIE